MAILSADTNPKLREERKAAEKAKAILGTLTPSSVRTDRTIFVLRHAANLAKTGALKRLESRHDLDGARIEVATALNEVCRLLDRGACTSRCYRPSDERGCSVAGSAAFLRPDCCENI